MVSSVDTPFAGRLTRGGRVIRFPRMQACPLPAAGSNAIWSNMRLVYQAKDRLRDRAIIALLGYTFARAGAVIQMKVEDYYSKKAPRLGAEA